MIKKNKIRISYIVPTLDKGGAERFLVDLLLNLDYQIFEIQLILFKHAGSFLQELNQNNISIIVLEKKHHLDLINFFQICKALIIFKPQIVHTQLGGDLYGRLAAKLLQIPIIISTEQNVNPDETWLKNKLKIITSFWAKKIIAISQAVAIDLKKRYNIDPEKIVIIPNGLNINKFLLENISNNHQPEKTKFLCGTIGRLVPQKGQSVLIQAIKILNKCSINCQIAGQGPLRETLKKEIDKAGLQSEIALVGEVDPVSFLRKLDFFVLPSLWEGQGIVLLEAALSGKPIIASNVDGISEIINEQTGFLVPAGNSQALADVIDYLIIHINDQEIKYKTDKLKNQVIAKYDITRITYKYMSLYHELLLNYHQTKHKN